MGKVIFVDLSESFADCPKSFSSTDQSPCVVAVELAGICIGGRE